MIDPRKLAAVVHDAVTEAVPEDLPGLIGTLAMEQARAMARLTAPAMSRAGAAEPAEDVNLSVSEAARRLGVSVDWVYRHRDKLPRVRIGRRLLFPRSALDRWNKQRQGR